MGLFKRKEYTLSQVLKLLTKEGYEFYTPVPINPEDEETKYWLVKESEKDTEGDVMLKSNKSTFWTKRDNFINEITNNGKYTEQSAYGNSINGKITVYNDYKSAKGYQKKFGQCR